MDKPDVVQGMPVISVVGAGFCFPFPVDLMVKKKITGFTAAQTEVSDMNGNLLLQIDGRLLQLRKKRVMCDPVGNPIITMQEKALSCGSKWTVHQGVSKEASNLLYTVQRSHPFQVEAQLGISLARNTEGNFNDFHVKYCDSSYGVYRGKNLIAEVKYNFKFGSFLLKGKENFEVRVYPGVDYAFVVSLVAILSDNFS